MTSAWEDFCERTRELHDLASAIKLMHWDQAVMLPPGGGAGRARSIATLESLAHDRLIDPAIGDLLERLASDENLDDVQRASVRVLRRDYDKATKVPGDLVRAMAEAGGLAYQAWTEARPEGDFSILQPHLTHFLDLKKQEADALGWEAERYDAMIDYFEPGMTTAEVAKLFEELVPGLKPIADVVLERAGDAPDFLSRPYDEGKQAAFCRWLVGHLGFDGRRGRLDESPHPFTMHVNAGDVRQTTRYQSKELLGAIYAAIHETGHALYEQGLPEDYLDLPVGSVPSLSIHESQSRLWENQVGRSRAFADFLLPKLKERFPEEFGMVDLDEFYRGVNHPKRTLIRVTADELTYNLHVALRFELEVAMFRDELEVADLPEAWDDAMERHLGIRPDGDADGVLQDMHWAIGAMGYFPTYTVGTLYAAALYRKAEEELGDLANELRGGDSSRLLEWLRANIHAHAYRYEAKDLLVNVLGATPGAEPFLEYLRTKYAALYDVAA